MGRRASAELVPGMRAAAKAYLDALTAIPTVVQWLDEENLRSCQVRIPESVREHRFHATRKWRFDHAWPTFKIALEVQGGIFTGGRHTRGAALLREHEKLNEAAIMGWRVLFTTPDAVADGRATKLIARAIANEGTR